MLKPVKFSSGMMAVGLLGVGWLGASGWAAQSAPATAPWSQKMRQMAPLVRSLTVELADSKALEIPATRQQVMRDSSQLAELAHELPQMRSVSPDTDPTVGLLASGLAEETGRAARAFKQGQPVYARHLLRSVTGYCVTCHSQAPGGESVVANPTDAGVQKLSPVDRAHLFAATRRFDSALTEYGKILESAPARSPEWEESLRSSLAIAVRVKEDPARAQALVDRALKAGSASESLKSAARGWQASLLEWMAEARSPGAQDPQSLLKRAQEWAARADKLNSFPMDRSGLVADLRAAGLLHQFLRTRPQGAALADALYLLARVQLPLGELPIAELPQLYFAACVRSAPHSPIAARCYQGYEEEVRAGFTGSSGTDIPADELDRLKGLRQLAQPETRRNPRT